MYICPAERDDERWRCEGVMRKRGWLTELLHASTSLMLFNAVVYLQSGATQRMLCVPSVRAICLLAGSASCCIITRLATAAATVLHTTHACMYTYWN